MVSQVFHSWPIGTITGGKHENWEHTREHKTKKQVVISIDVNILRYASIIEAYL